MLDSHPLEIRLLDPRHGTDWPLPEYGTPGAAGLDLRYAGTTPLELLAGQSAMVPTGLSIHIGDHGLVGLVFPRSSLGRRGVILGNGTAVIDADYQGEIQLLLWNRQQHEPVTLSVGERVAQLVLMPVVHASLKVVQEFTVSTVRGKGGFGSTGTI